MSKYSSETLVFKNVLPYYELVYDATYTIASLSLPLRTSPNGAG
jgi:hypothetical protein